MVVLGIALILIEYSYRKENGKRGVNAIEVILLASHTLSIAHVVEAQKLNFDNYILVSSYIISIYYLFKAICIHTREKRKYLKSLSDIKEIVTNDPVKKVATKKKGEAK